MAPVENDDTDPEQRPLPSRPDKAVAVALRYDPNEDAAPKVTASGRGSVAERIIAAARDAGVPIHSDDELARVLAAVDLDGQIPVAVFTAVAEILVCLYRANATLPPAPTRGDQGESK